MPPNHVLAEYDSFHLSFISSDGQPANLYRAQLILRAKSLVLKTCSAKPRNVQPAIKRVFTLNPSTAAPESGAVSPSPAPSQGFDIWGTSDSGESANSAVDVSQLQADIETQREEISRINSTGLQAVSSFEGAVSRTEQKVQQLNDMVQTILDDHNRTQDGLALAEQKIQLLTGIIEIVREAEAKAQDDVTRLKSQISDLKRPIAEEPEIISLNQNQEATHSQLGELDQRTSHLGREIDLLKDRQANYDETDSIREGEAVDMKKMVDELCDVTREFIKEVSALRNEVKSVSEAQANKPAPVDPELLSDELDLLSSNVSRIGNQASLIEPLKMDLELFRARLERFEARVSSVDTRQSNTRALEMDAESPINGLNGVQLGHSTAQKRTSESLDNTQFLGGTPPKRRAFMSDDSATPSARSSTEDELQSSPSVLLGAKLAPHVTSSGSVSKRLLRRGLIPATTADLTDDSDF